MACEHESNHTKSCLGQLQNPVETYKSFHKFSDLPKELRMIIWEHALLQPRLLCLTLVWRQYRSEDPWSIGWREVRDTTTKVRSSQQRARERRELYKNTHLFRLMEACREAKEMCLRNYIILQPLKDGIDVLRRAHPCEELVDPRQDVVMASLDQFETLESEKISPGFANITKLAVKVSFTEPEDVDNVQFCSHVRQFAPCLEELHVVVGLDTKLLLEDRVLENIVLLEIDDGFGTAEFQTKSDNSSIIEFHRDFMRNWENFAIGIRGYIRTIARDDEYWKKVAFKVCTIAYRHSIIKMRWTQIQCSQDVLRLLDSFEFALQRYPNGFLVHPTLRSVIPCYEDFTRYHNYEGIRRLFDMETRVEEVLGDGTSI